MLKTTLCYLEYNDCYLMLYRNKKNQDLNAGKWIGVGGKFLEDESEEECVLREVFEETGYKLDAFEKRGTIYFYQKDETGKILDEEVMYLSTAKVDSPDFKECNEGTLKWIPKEEIMGLNLWEGDRIFLPRLIAGEMGINMSLYYLGDKLEKVLLDK